MHNPDFEQIEETLSVEPLTPETLQRILLQIGIPDVYRPQRVFPVGVAVNDGVGDDFEIARDDMPAFLQDFAVPGVNQLRIYPLGTPDDSDAHGGVDRYRVQMQVGRRVE